MSHVKHPSHAVDTRTSSQIARARAQTLPSGPTSADAVIAVRPSRGTVQPHAHRVRADESRQPPAQVPAVGGARRADESLGDDQGGHPSELREAAQAG
jgi:hypothetical protein